MKFQHEHPTGSLNVLDWWRLHQTDYPILSIMARCVYSTKPASASNERDFSFAGYLDDPLRSNLNTDTFRDLVYVKSYHRPPMVEFLDFIRSESQQN